MSENTGSRVNFLYSSPSVCYGRTSGGSSAGNHHPLPISTFQLQSGGSDCFQSDQAHPIVKTEANNTSQPAQIFQYPLMRGLLHQTVHQQGGSQSSSEVEAIKAKIIAHPQYSNLLEAFLDCQKVRNFLVEQLRIAKNIRPPHPFSCF